MPISFKKCCPQCMSSHGCFSIKFVSSHVEYSMGKFFHLIRYSEIDRFYSYQVLISMIALGSNINFPSFTSYRNIVWTKIVSPITFSENETWKTSCTRGDADIQRWKNMYARVPFLQHLIRDVLFGW